MNTRHTLGSLILGTALVATAASSSSAEPAGPGAAPVVTATTLAAAHGPRMIPLPKPADFRRHVTNRFYPLRPGARWVYLGYGSEAKQRTVVRVLHRTKMIEGIRATVVSDRVTEAGKLIEQTYDWYAQDRRGRVWYLGEDSTAYSGGTTSTAGSWETGVDGARAGVVMFAQGRIYRRYWQEYYAGQAEDQGVLLDRRSRTSVPAGNYRRVRMTKDISPLEPKVMELKFYAPGVGLVLELGVSPDQGRVELVRFTGP
jgi:hypothetical protein